MGKTLGRGVVEKLPLGTSGTGPPEHLYTKAVGRGVVERSELPLGRSQPLEGQPHGPPEHLYTQHL